MRARLRSALVCALLGVLGCRDQVTEQPDPDDGAHSRNLDEQNRKDVDSRVDPTRCTGDGLELAALVGTGLCSITGAEALALPSVEQLEIEAPRKLVVAAGERLDFELVLRNRSAEPLHVDLRLRQFLPLAPESTTRVDGDSGPDTSCTLRAMSTEPPPERVTLPPEAELAIPCEWYANTRLVDPHSYFGSECPDFPALPPGRYRSVFRINGGAGTQRDVVVDIDVRTPKR